MKIWLYNKIAQCGLDLLPPDARVGRDFEDPCGILVRSADLRFETFPASLRAVARAGAGVNNIPVAALTEKGVAVFNTPGANAGAVTELVLAALLLTSRKIAEGIWFSHTLAGNPAAEKLVEQEKSRFAGPEIRGKTLGIVGLGAIGSQVAKMALSLGMKVVGFDPYLSVKAKEELPFGVAVSVSPDEIFSVSDYITLHVPSLPTTRGFFCRENILKMKDGVRLLNLARGDLAVEEDIIKALDSGKVAAYFTDFPSRNLAGKRGVIATPHLGASTPEAEENCAVMAVRQLTDFLTCGNITNSVNLPNVFLERKYANRIGIIAKRGADFEHLISHGVIARGERGDWVYALCERDAEFDVEKIKTVGGVVRVTSY